MQQTLIDDLKALTCEGNIASLPTDHLNDYAALKKALLKANGKYKSNTFVFPTPAQEVIDLLLSGTVVDFKKEFQAFFTPEALAEEMTNEIIGFTDAVNVLEPSAGHGALMDAILKARPAACIHACELSDLNFRVLEEKYGNKAGQGIRLFEGDFLALELDPPYDIIIANPPFTKNQDIDHIRKMYDLLADGGQLITLSSLSWTFGEQQKQKEFRAWLDDIGAAYRELEAGAFKESGTNVKAVLITVNK